jgi:hypothetical protein
MRFRELIEARGAVEYCYHSTDTPIEEIARQGLRASAWEDEEIDEVVGQTGIHYCVFYTDEPQQDYGANLLRFPRSAAPYPDAYSPDRGSFIHAPAEWIVPAHALEVFPYGTYRETKESWHRLWTIETFPRTVLKVGTRLYHGTDASGFDVPQGPAWFTTDLPTAQKWAGWTRSGQDRKVIEVEVTRDVPLLDTTVAQNWFDLCLSLTGDSEAPIGQMAHAVAGQCPGWWSQDPTGDEVMLSSPADYVKPVGHQAVPTSVRSFGDVG